MKLLAFTVFLLIAVNLLISRTFALTCYSCLWVQGTTDQIECAFGGTSLPVSSERNANQESIKGMSNLENAREGNETKEACVTAYGPAEKTGIYRVIRGKLPKVETRYIGRCYNIADDLSTLCLCDTDRCNSEVPAGILKCHLCVHTAQEPNLGCVRATETSETFARKAGAATKDKAALSKITAGALDLHKSSQSAGRQDPNRPNKYQKCFTFEGTMNGISTFVRAKFYIAADYNGCVKTPQEVIDKGIDGTYCACSTDLCNSKPGNADKGSGGASDTVLGSSLVSVIIVSTLKSL